MREELKQIKTTQILNIYKNTGLWLDIKNLIQDNTGLTPLGCSLLKKSFQKPQVGVPLNTRYVIQKKSANRDENGNKY